MSDDWRDWYDEENDGKWIYGTMTTCLFIYWIIVEILERKFGMEPKVFTSEKVNQLAKMVRNEYQESEMRRRESSREDSSSVSVSSRGIDDMIDSSAADSDNNYKPKRAKSQSATYNYNDKPNDDGSPKLGIQVTPFGVEDMKMSPSGNTSADDGNYDKNNKNDKNDKNKAPQTIVLSYESKKNEKNEVVGPSSVVSLTGKDEKLPKQKPKLKKEKSKLSQFKDNIVTHMHFGEDSASMLHRLTKQMDTKGRYRVTVRSAVSMMRVIKNIVLNAILIWSFFKFPDWWYQHVWVQNHETIFCTPLRVAYLILGSFYLWDLNVNRYGRLSWSTIFHHTTVTISIFRVFVFDAFVPSATVFGAFGVSFGYLLHFSMVLRYMMPKSKWLTEHADIVRKMFVVSYYAYIVYNFICNIGLQLVVFVRGAQTGRLTTFQLIWMVICICVWMYEDKKVLKVLKEYSEQHYEVAELLQIKDTYCSVHETKQEQKQDKKFKKLFRFYKKRKNN